MADFSAPVYSTYLGGNNSDYVGGAAVDSHGNVSLAGSSYSTNFPVYKYICNHRQLSRVLIEVAVMREPLLAAWGAKCPTCHVLVVPKKGRLIDDGGKDSAFVTNEITCPKCKNVFTVKGREAELIHLSRHVFDRGYITEKEYKELCEVEGLRTDRKVCSVSR